MYIILYNVFDLVLSHENNFYLELTNLRFFNNLSKISLQDNTLLLSEESACALKVYSIGSEHWTGLDYMKTHRSRLCDTSGSSSLWTCSQMT